MSAPSAAVSSPSSCIASRLSGMGKIPLQLGCSALIGFTHISDSGESDTCIGENTVTCLVSTPKHDADTCYVSES